MRESQGDQRLVVADHTDEGPGGDFQKPVVNDKSPLSFIIRVGNGRGAKGESVIKNRRLVRVLRYLPAVLKFNREDLGKRWPT